MKYVKYTCRVHAYRYGLNYDDLLGDSLEKLWRYKDSFRFEKGNKGFCNWAGFVIYSVSIDTYRRKKRKFDEINLDYAADLVTPSFAYDDVELVERSIEVLQQLHKKHHGIIHMVNDGYSYQEIADMLDMKLNTVKGSIRNMRLSMIEQRKKLQEV